MVDDAEGAEAAARGSQQKKVTIAPDFQPSNASFFSLQQGAALVVKFEAQKSFAVSFALPPPGGSPAPPEAAVEKDKGKACSIKVGMQTMASRLGMPTTKSMAVSFAMPPERTGSGESDARAIAAEAVRRAQGPPTPPPTPPPQLTQEEWLAQGPCAVVLVRVLEQPPTHCTVWALPETRGGVLRVSWEPADGAEG
eukprot:gene32513-13862_t